MFLLLLLSSCAQQPSRLNKVLLATPWSIQQQQIVALNNWQLTGKIAIFTPTERHSFNIHWQQLEDNLQISLTTFLGISVLKINKTALLTTVIDAQGKTYTAPNADVLIYSLSRLDIPVELLQQWIKGNPVQANYRLNKNNQVAQLKQKNVSPNSWSIRYSDYQTLTGIALPYKLELQRKDVRLKFAIEQWKILP